MNALEATVAKVEHEMYQLEADIRTADAQGRAEAARQLRRKEEQLREKELIALRASGKQHHLHLPHAETQYRGVPQ